MRFSTIIVDLSISPYSSINFCFIYFDVLLLSAYTLRIVFLKIMYCLSLFLVIFLVLKSTWFDINIVTPTLVD